MHHNLQAMPYQYRILFLNYNNQNLYSMETSGKIVQNGQNADKYLISLDI